MTGQAITHALVLAAGFGSRMKPLTDSRPKPLIRLGGKALIDHALDRLAQAGVTDAIVNVHYLAEQILEHLAGRTAPHIAISDERTQILDTGGAVCKARALLGDGAFFVHNSDSVWIESRGSTLARMIAAWDGDRMDALLLLAPRFGSLGYSGRGDFHLGRNGAVSRRADGEEADHVFAGVSINHPRLFATCPEGPFSINRAWDEALAGGRLVAVAHEGLWMHVGTPEALAEAERRLDGQSAA